MAARVGLMSPKNSLYAVFISANALVGAESEMNTVHSIIASMLEPAALATSPIFDKAWRVSFPMPPGTIAGGTRLKSMPGKPEMCMRQACCRKQVLIPVSKGNGKWGHPGTLIGALVACADAVETRASMSASGSAGVAIVFVFVVVVIIVVISRTVDSTAWCAGRSASDTIRLPSLIMQ